MLKHVRRSKVAEAIRQNIKSQDVIRRQSYRSEKSTMIIVKMIPKLQTPGVIISEANSNAN